MNLHKHTRTGGNQSHIDTFAKFVWKKKQKTKVSGVFCRYLLTFHHFWIFDFQGSDQRFWGQEISHHACKWCDLGSGHTPQKSSWGNLLIHPKISTRPVDWLDERWKKGAGDMETNLEAFIRPILYNHTYHLSSWKMSETDVGNRAAFWRDEDQTDHIFGKGPHPRYLLIIQSWQWTSTNRQHQKIPAAAKMCFRNLWDLHRHPIETILAKEMKIL